MKKCFTLPLVSQSFKTLEHGIIVILVDVKDHMEFSGTYKATLVVGDPIMHPGIVTVNLGEVTITGLPESTVTGSWNRKYLQKVGFHSPKRYKINTIADILYIFSTINFQFCHIHSKNQNHAHQ